MSAVPKYSDRYLSLIEIARRLQSHLETILTGYTNIDAVRCRAKKPESFERKSQKRDIKGNPVYEDPLSQIQDQIGARIVVFYTTDISKVEKAIEDYFSSIEEQFKEPDQPHEFGYIGKHYILALPIELYGESREGLPTFFELQIKTLFQHAWGQANHDLCYKSKKDMTPEQKRKVAFTAAQAWGADSIYAELSLEFVN